MNLDETSHLHLVESYAIIHKSLTGSRRVMYDDYDLDYSFSNDFNLDEDSYNEYRASDLDEDYTRDGQDYQDLAYRHYAWYNSVQSHLVLMIAQKRQVRVVLDIECYDDLDLEDINWREVLQLEGGEEVHYNIKDLDPFMWCDSWISGTRILLHVPFVVL